MIERSEPREGQAGKASPGSCATGAARLGSTAPGRPLRVLFANNYDMARARAGVRAETYPSHHLYGTADMGEEFEVVDLPFAIDGLMARATRLARFRLGNVGQQLTALRRWQPGSVIYGAAAPDIRSLATMRAARLLPVPVVGVFHSAVSSRISRWSATGGFDRLITLTEHTRRGLIDAGVAPEQVTTLPWGADMDFPGFGPRPPAAADAPVVATGKTARDMRTLLIALAETGLPARLYGDRAQLERLAPVPSGVTVCPIVSNFFHPGPMVYDEQVTADLRSAALVAIPLLGTDRLTGLTEVVDALACGRPMILTRTPHFDFDIEEIGCGWWVEPGDVAGWARLLREATADRDRLDRMGRAGREWAERHLNARLFSVGLRRVLLEAAGRLPA